MSTSHVSIAYREKITKNYNFCRLYGNQCDGDIIGEDVRPPPGFQWSTEKRMLVAMNTLDNAHKLPIFMIDAYSLGKIPRWHRKEVNTVSLADRPVFQLGRENGQGAKEIGHNVACERRKSGHNLVRKRHKIGHSLECDRPSHTFTRERPKFGHNPVCERNEVWAQFCGRSMKTWHKSASILQAFLHRLSQNKKTAITFLKKKELKKN